MNQPLHHALRHYLRRGGTVLEHPLVVQPYCKDWNAIYNRQYRDRIRAIQRAKKAGNWSQIIWFYERRFRPEALQKIAPLLTDEQYWRMVSTVWLDAEAISLNRMVWTQIWLSKRAGRDQVMTHAEYQRFAELCDGAGRVPIYRGCGSPQMVSGLSWTVNQAVAMMYASRYETPLLVSATVETVHIEAYFQRGNESEVVVLPRHCLDLVVTPLENRDAEANRTLVADAS